MTDRSVDARAGFTLVEVLTATAIVAIGFVACAMAFQQALAGIESGRRETAATFLAEWKVEELKAVALAHWGSGALTAATRTEYCVPATDGCTPTATTGSYRVVTTVMDLPSGTCACKVVRVFVSYQVVGTRGFLDREGQVELVTLFASRT